MHERRRICADVEACIPVDETLGFTAFLRNHLSGFAVLQLVFSHLEMVDKDPFLSAQTEEEPKDLDMVYETAEQSSITRLLINSVSRYEGIESR